MITKYEYPFIEKIANNMKQGDALRKSKLPKLQGYNKTTHSFNNNDKVFNIYEPKSNYSEDSVIIDIHGGARIYGDADLNDEYNEYLCLKGYKIVSLDYPLIGEKDINLEKMVQYLIDVLNYIYLNRQKFGLNFENILLTGDSAGAHLALLVYGVLNSDKLRKVYDIQKTFISSNLIKLICFSFPALEFHNFMKVEDENSKKMLNTFLKLAFNNSREEVKSHAALSEIINLIQFPEILLITSKKDYFNFQAELAKNIFANNGVNIEYLVVPYEDKLDHVFNIAYYFYEESIQINDYMLKKFETIKNAL